MKHLFIAYKLFDNILKNEPMMTGCYQWIKALNSDCKNWQQMEQTKEELEQYDIIQINADPMDLRLLIEVRRILGNSSKTKIVLNQDHSPELWDETFPFFVEFQRAIDEADFVFATTPYARNLMQTQTQNKKIYLIPHPCDTEALKSIDSFIHNNHLIYFWHRYDHQMIIPYLTTKDLNIPVSVGGYMEDHDPHNKIFTKTLKWSVYNYMKYPDFLKFIKEAKIGYDPFNSYSYGRVPCDCACLGLPIVCSEFNYSARICYPYTCINPFNVVNARQLLKRLLNDKEFYNKVRRTALEKVEFFSLENSKKKYMRMIKND